VRPDRLLAAQLEKLSAELAGAGAEQDREKLLPLINTDRQDRKGKAYRGSTRMNTDQNRKKKT
jgi:hypothetical protein